MDKNEAIKILREKVFDKALFSVRTAFETLIPELAESEDERIRKNCIHFLELQKKHHADTSEIDGCIAYLEKQKEQPKEELVYRLNGLMQDYIKEGKDEDEKEHRFKCYQLFWDALEDANFFEQKEQKPAEIDEYEIIKKHITEDSLSSEVNKRLKECGWYVTDDKPAEWSEEDEAMLANVFGTYKILEDMLDLSTEQDRNTLESMNFERDWLKGRFKSLRPQSHWKPSEEQMNALNSIILCYSFIPLSLTYIDQVQDLISLKDDLKKLM